MTQINSPVSLSRALVGRGFGAIEAFGRGLVRPDDEVWRLASAHLRDGRLLLRFAQPGTSGSVLLSVGSPSGVRADADGLTVQRAADVRWPGLRASVTGRRVCWKANGEPSEEALPAKPALSLRLSR